MIGPSYKNIETDLSRTFFDISYIYFKHEVQVSSGNITYYACQRTLGGGD